MPQKPPPSSLIVFSFFHTPFSASFKSLHQVSALSTFHPYYSQALWESLSPGRESAEHWISASCRSPAPASEKAQRWKTPLSFLFHIKRSNIFIFVKIILISSWSNWNAALQEGNIWNPNLLKSHIDDLLIHFKNISLIMIMTFLPNFKKKKVF